MSDLEVVVLPNGAFQENCYLVGPVGSGAAVVIDPGEEIPRVLAEAGARGWILGAIWLTHAHLDHLLGVAEVHHATKAIIALHPDDRALYEAFPQQAAAFGYRGEPLPPPDRWLAHGDEVVAGGQPFAVRHVPGHSPGHVAFRGPGVIFGGDVLFQDSIGRTDLPGGDLPTLLASITREFLSLPDETVVHPGHGPATTIGRERTHNPFLTRR